MARIAQDKRYFSASRTDGRTPDAITTLLSSGDPGSGHRSRAAARNLLAAFKRDLGLPQKAGSPEDRLMEDFLVEVVLSAIWYQHHYKQARRRVLSYIALNVLAILGLPIALIGVSAIATKLGDKALPAQIGAEITSVLTGILGLQKTLSGWYASQQRYAAWYKSSADLKSIYFAFVQAWSGKTVSDSAGFTRALLAATQSGRDVVSAEQLDFYQKLALPSFDLLDLLTAGRSSVSSFVSSFVPGAPDQTVSTIGRSTMTTGSPASPPAILHPAPITPASQLPPGFVFAPGGPRPLSSVSCAEDGIVTDAMKFGSSEATPAPGVSMSSNWITGAEWMNNTGKVITRFETRWTVPPEPTSKQDQILFLFNGMQPSDSSWILQPVLQWGRFGDNARTGPFWTAACWLLGGPNNTATHTKHQRVNPGDELVGWINAVSDDSGQLKYQCGFEGIGPPLSPGLLPELTCCFQTLEAYTLQRGNTPRYDLDALEEYPAAASMAFRNINVVTDNPISTQWQPFTLVSDFGEHTEAPASAAVAPTVEIFFTS